MATQVIEQTSESILTENRASDVPYRWTVNPYRGCEFGCAFCWGRGTHEYLRLDPDLDFERVLFVKTNAAERLAEAFAKPSWRGDTVMFSPVTDPYQPLEARYELTKRCLNVCLEHRNPVMLMTRSTLILRDVELLRLVARDARLELSMGLAFSDAELSRLLEPGAPPLEERLACVRRLSEAGLDVGVTIGPVIPDLNEDQVSGLLERAASVGATWASWVLLRTPPPIGEVFSRRLRALLPERAEAVLERSLGHTHGRGSSPEARDLHQKFENHCDSLGLRVRNFQKQPEPPTTFQRPPHAQLPLL